MKKILLLVITILLWTSCDHDEQLLIDTPNKQTKGVVLTDLEHDPQAKELFHTILPKSGAGRINSGIEISEIYKYFDLQKDIINYSVSLPDTSNNYFENLIISKIGNDFYGYILRYTFNEEYLSGISFQGLIQRYNLEGELIGEYNIPNGNIGGRYNNPSGRTKLIYQCVVGYESYCWEEYEISTATGLPIPETLTTVCVNETIYGWCGDTAGPMPSPYDGGWGTYIPPSSGGGSTSGSGDGSTQYDPYSPDIVPTDPPDNYESPVVIIEDEYVIDSKTQFLIDKWEATKINDTQLKPCMQSIVTDLKNITQGSVGQIIQKFSGTTPGWNWELKDGSLSGGTGQTDPPALYNQTTGTVTTTFDSQAWLNATDLSWARTILHESVHAYLSVYFATDQQNFIRTYSQMVQDWGTLQNWDAVHHEEFARSLVTAIADALQSYGTSKGYSLTRQFYEDMSWAGLQGTSTFKNLPAADQTRILDTIAVELTGMDTKGNSVSQKGNNAGC